MISTSKPIKNAEQCKYYLDMTQSKYYANRYELAGHWAGEGAKLLGLSEPVQGVQLQNLFNGFSPDGKTKLVQNAGSKDRQRGYDFVPAPDKSVSVLWAMSDPKERVVIERIHDEAVQAVADFYQENAAFTRRGKGGAIVEPTALVIACFAHGTSRAMDMQLHTHMVILNIGIRSDGTTGALYNDRLFELRKQADLVYQTHLALGLRMELGLELEPVGQAFQIKGVPRDVCDFFSKRRAEILKYMKDHGLKGPEAAYEAAMKTRPEKRHVEREEQFLIWQRIGNFLGWGPDQARKLSRDKKAMEIYQGLKEREARKTDGGLVEEKQNAAANTRPADDPRGSKDHRLNDGLGGQQTQSTSSQTEGESPSCDQERMRKPREKTFKQISKDRFILKHRRWGEVLWKKNLGIVEIRVQMKKLQPKAPGWTKASKLAIPAIRIIPWKIKLFDAPVLHKRPRSKVLWKKSFLFAELRVQKQQLFPNAPAWSPIQKVVLPRLSLGFKSPEPPKPKNEEKSKQSETKTMEHSH